MGLDTVEFLMHAEKEFDITITDAEAGEIYTVDQFSKLCHQKILQKPNSTLSEEQVFESLKRILLLHFLSKNAKIKREDLIVKDLGLN